jgi:hypothetical protein
VSLSETIKRIYHIFVRELVIMWRHPIFGFCTLVFPVLVVLFFTTLMNGGQPVDMPVGVVDQDNTHVSRAMIRKLDGFQTTQIVGHYANMNDAREAIQKNEIYAFLLIPKGTTDKLLDGDQPKISFYYSNVTLVAGSLLYRDLKTVASLGSAAVGSAKLSAIGKTSKEIRTFLQPITIDLHQIGNPWSNYNVYLSTAMVPGVLMIFVFLLTPYSIGTELKFHRSKQWMKMADNNIHIAIAGKISSADHALYVGDVVLRVLHLLWAPLPSSGRYRTNLVTRLPLGLCLSVLRHLHLRPHAFLAYVDVNMLAMVSGKLLSLRCYLSGICHGLNDSVDGSALPTPPLLHDLPDVYLQRLSAELRLVRFPGSYHLCFPPDVHHQEYQEGNACLRLHSIILRHKIRHNIVHEERRSVIQNTRRHL